MSLFWRKLSNVYTAFRAIGYALRYDFSCQWHFFVTPVVLAVFIWYFQPITQTEYLFLGLAWVLTTITELQNSAVETALDRLHPERHDDIGLSKDLAAGAVTMSALFLVAVMAVIAFL